MSELWKLVDNGDDLWLKLHRSNAERKRDITFELSAIHRKIQDRIDAILVYDFYKARIGGRGYMTKDSWYYDTQELAAQGLFRKCTTDTKDGINNWDAVVAPDVYTSYSWPSAKARRDADAIYKAFIDKNPSLAGSEKAKLPALGFFVRCNPQNFGCQTIGRDLTVLQGILMIVVVVAAVLVTIYTAGASTPATTIVIESIVAGLTAGTTQIANFKRNGTVDPQAVFESGEKMYNIYNGADYEVDSEDPNDHDEVLRISGEYVYKNEDLAA